MDMTLNFTRTSFQREGPWIIAYSSTVTERKSIHMRVSSIIFEITQADSAMLSGWDSY